MHKSKNNIKKIYIHFAIDHLYCERQHCNERICCDIVSMNRFDSMGSAVLDLRSKYIFIQFSHQTTLKCVVSGCCVLI